MQHSNLSEKLLSTRDIGPRAGLMLCIRYQNRRERVGDFELTGVSFSGIPGPSKTTLVARARVRRTHVSWLFEGAARVTEIVVRYRPWGSMCKLVSSTMARGRVLLEQNCCQNFHFFQIVFTLDYRWPVPHNNFRDSCCFQKESWDVGSPNSRTSNQCGFWRPRNPRKRHSRQFKISQPLPSILKYIYSCYHTAFYSK